MKKRPIFTATAIAVLVCLLIWPLAMQAQRRSMTEWEALVRIKLAGFALILGIFDAHLTYDPYIGTLHDNTYTELTVTLRKGVRYVLIGVCDDDCGNLNMKLYDDDDYLIAQDTARTTTPDLEIMPEHTQTFTVHMSMRRCDADYCYYGLGVYSK
jgi:hypothetical protein